MLHPLIIHPDTLRKLFKFEPFLRQEFHFGMDPDRPICTFYQPLRPLNSCPQGDMCPNKHVAQLFNNKIVCKHWLRGLCKKNTHCEFLHEYNLRKMPECMFFAKNGYCTQTPECLYLHVDPMLKIPECVNYKRGFCPDGPKCPMRHIRRTICPLYLTGFCPKGPNCEHTHPRFENVPDKLYIGPDVLRKIIMTHPLDNLPQRDGDSLMGVNGESNDSKDDAVTHMSDVEIDPHQPSADDDAMQDSDGSDVYEPMG